METIRSLIEEYTDKFNNISATPRLDTELLLRRALGDKDKMYLLMNPDLEVGEKEEREFKSLCDQRLKSRPIAYTLGNREFMGLDFYVDERVLIPRPDTEILVEYIIEQCNMKLEPDGRVHDELKILDIGTGSGAISISLSYYLRNVEVTAVDISSGALDVAKFNASKILRNDRIRFIESDLFSNLKGKSFDIIASNPPYIPSSEVLESQVRDYEPHGALFGGDDGLDYYRRIIEDAPDYLNQGGRIILEVGHDQAESVMRLLEERGFRNIRTEADLQGFQRVVIGSIL